MKKAAVFNVLCVLLLCVNAQDICLTHRATEQNLFFYDKHNPSLSQIQCDSAVYGQNTDWQGNLVSLKFNVWYPKPGVDTFHKRPFAIIIHGGGFTGGNRYQKDSICISLACKGIVAATIDYRKGKQSGNAQSGYNAQYRAFQDARAALRYFYHHHAVYGIDTSAMFIGGSSAGGITALHAAFLSQSEADSDPEYKNCRINQQLGHLDSATCPHYEIPNIRGVINMWGGITDTSYINHNDKRPVLCMHGELDPTVSINVFNMAGTYYGSRPICNRLRNLNECYRFLIDKQGGHGGYGNPNSPFPIEEWKGKQIACFIRAVLCQACTLNAPEDTTLAEAHCSQIITNVQITPVSDTKLRISPVSTDLFKVFANYHTLNSIAAFLPDGRRVACNVLDVTSEYFLIRINLMPLSNSLLFFKAIGTNGNIQSCLIVVP